MFQLELCPRDTEWSLLLEELAEVLHLLTKGVTLAAYVYGLSLLKWGQDFTPACINTISNLNMQIWVIVPVYGKSRHRHVKHNQTWNVMMRWSDCAGRWQEHTMAETNSRRHN